MQDLKITLVQTSLVWEDIQANLAHFDKLLSPVTAGSTGLIILPEMFSTGFSMKVESLAETMKGRAVRWLQDKAAEKSVVMAASIMIRENDHFYNRLVWMQPDGTYDVYDKRHMFGMGNEDQYFTPGTKRLIVKLNGWKICPQVCYDLRFPVWNRNRQDYDLIFFIANWPERRNFAWKALLQARAIENQAYVVGVNRIGKDGNGIYHSGDSSLIDPLGEIIFTGADMEFVKTFTVSKERLQYVREKMPFLNDADDFVIKIEGEHF